MQPDIPSSLLALSPCIHCYTGRITLIMHIQGSFVASGHTKVLSLRRSTMEKKLGPLQSVIDQAGVRIAKGEAMKEKDESLVASLQVGATKEKEESLVASRPVVELRCLHPPYTSRAHRVRQAESVLFLASRGFHERTSIRTMGTVG